MQCTFYLLLLELNQTPRPTIAPQLIHKAGLNAQHIAYKPSMRMQRTSLYRYHNLTMSVNHV